MSSTSPMLAPIPLVDVSRSPDDERAAATPVQHLMALARQYGPIFQVAQPGPRLLVASSFDLVDELCDEQRFDKVAPPPGSLLREVVGDGLFTASTHEPNWRKAHNILLPTFSPQAMQGYLPAMLDLAEQLVLKWARLNPDDEIDVPGDMTRLTLDTIGLCGFDYRFNSLYREGMHPFVASLVRVLEAGRQGVGGLLATDGHGEDMGRQLRDDIASMNAMVDTIIQERKASGAEAAAQHDLLSYMLTGVDKQTGERLDDVNMRYQILTFLIAGHETTSSLLSFALYFLVKHPEILARAYDAADRVLGGDLSATPTYAQVNQLTYVSQILKEALRLWPPAPMVVRRYPYATTVLGGTYQVERDDQIMLLLPMLHRDKAVWGEQSEEFDPEHFSPEAEQVRPANAFKPFGTGQRACIGRQFAMQEATLALGMLLQRFEFVDHTNYQLQLRQTGAIKPDHLTIKVRPRTQRLVAGAPVQPAPLAHAEPGPAPVAAAQHNTPLLVLYGSNLGTAEGLAHRIADESRARGFAVAIAPLDDYTDKLPTTGAVLVVTSSYNGTPPDNAVKFCGWLRGNTIAIDHLRGVRYAVFGCGDHEWTATFQAIPRLIDRKLEAYGARRIYPRGEGDVRGDFDGQFHAWYGSLWGTLAGALGVDTGPVQTTVQGSLYSVALVTAPEANPFAVANGAQPLPVLVNRELQVHRDEQPMERSTRHIEVALAAGMTYRTGDHLGVLPHNSIELVQRVLTRFGLARDAFLQIHRNRTVTTPLPLDQPVSVVGLLARYVELQDVATRAQVKTLADYTDSPAEKQALLALADDPRYSNEVLAQRLSLMGVLEGFPACILPFEIYLEMLRVLRPRYYSISSSPLADAQTCSIAVAVVEGQAHSGQGIYHGVCSSYLQQQPTHSVVYGFIRAPQMPFRPPEDPTIPIIMIGPGTGFAPFRGFLQERAVLKAKETRLGKALLFFGCRDPEQDFIYQDELQAWVAQGVTELSTAFSRAEGLTRTYVQDKIKERQDEVWQMIQDGAIIYVCGDAGRMEPAVRKALATIYQEQTGASVQEADWWLAELADAHRYLADVWA